MNSFITLTNQKEISSAAEEIYDELSNFSMEAIKKSIHFIIENKKPGQDLEILTINKKLNTNNDNLNTLVFKELEHILPIWEIIPGQGKNILIDFLKLSIYTSNKKPDKETKNIVIYKEKNEKEEILKILNVNELKILKDLYQKFN